MIAPTEMRITGREIFRVAVLLLTIRFAIKNSKFNEMKHFLKPAKYRQLLWAALVFPLFLGAQLKTSDSILTGSERPGAYLPLLYDKSVAVVANQTSMVHDQHLVDFLLANDVNVVKVFAPEHGFRGQASAGEKVLDGKDSKTGLPIISLYGSNKKPRPEQLADVDVIVFDIQDVGARFYTYISTMTYVMEACAENNKKLVILDRPNPNGYYVDGPVLDPQFSSFVGMHPVPVVHGMTIGEYAAMVNGEGWLAGGRRCPVDIVKTTGWDHGTRYKLPVKPSPNLPNALAIALYPSVCFFEGTSVSVGRGTDKPFQQIGAPYFTQGNISFTPKPNEGAKNPKYEGQECRGFDLTNFAQYYITGLGELYLYWLTEAYQMAPDKSGFFNASFFDKLAGTDQLRKDIMAGKSADEIKASWQPALNQFKQVRRKYILYPDYLIKP